MNILYHHRTMGRGAEGAHIAHIVNAFKALGHCVIVVSPPGVDPLSDVGRKPLDKSDEKTTGITTLWKAISRHCPQIIFELLEIGYNFSAILKLNKTIKGQKIDFIYERSAFFLFAGAYVANRYKIPLVIEANEAVGIERARKLFLSKIAKTIERYSFNHSHSIFTVSSYLADLIHKNVDDQDKVHVTPNAIDPKKFERTSKRDEIRQKFGLTEKIVLGFAGWFDWWDRLDMLIDIQSELTKAGNADVVTMLIGHGAMVEDLKKQATALGIQDNVVLTGPVPKSEVLDYIDALDIGVLPHSNDFGSPMIMFEMMALGKCVIAPELPPVLDVIQEGVNGFLFPALSRERLTQQILFAIGHTEIRHKAGSEARRCVMADHTWLQNALNILKNIPPLN